MCTMNVDDKLRLQRNHQLIVDNVRLRDVVDKLVSSFVLDDDLVQEIESKTTERRQIQELLRILSKRGPNAYKSFRDALMPEDVNAPHQHIVRALDDTDLVKARKLFHEAVDRPSALSTSRANVTNMSPISGPSTSRAGVTNMAPISGPSTSGAGNTNMAASLGPSTSRAGVTNMAASLGPSTIRGDSYDTTDGGLVSCNRPTESTKPKKTKLEKLKNMIIKSADMPYSPIDDTNEHDLNRNIIPAGPKVCAIAPDTRYPQVNYSHKGDNTTIIPASGATGDSQLRYPTGVAYCSQTNTILVADRGNKRIIRFDTDGSNGRNFVMSFGPLNCGKCKPHDVATSQSGKVFVTDRKKDRVVVFTHDGNYVTSFGSHGRGDDQFDGMSGITCHNGYVLVCDSGNGRVTMLTEIGRFIRHIVSGLCNPRYVAVGPGNTIYVTNYDVTINRVQSNVRVYSWDGTPVRQFGEKDCAGSEPSGVTVDHQGYVCVAWCLRDRVAVYDPHGDLKITFGKKGKKPGELKWPQGMALLPGGRLVVCDSDNNRLQIF